MLWAWHKWPPQEATLNSLCQFQGRSKIVVSESWMILVASIKGTCNQTDCNLQGRKKDAAVTCWFHEISGAFLCNLAHAFPQFLWNNRWILAHYKMFFLFNIQLTFLKSKKHPVSVQPCPYKMNINLFRHILFLDCHFLSNLVLKWNSTLQCSIMFL